MKYFLRIFGLSLLLMLILAFTGVFGHKIKLIFAGLGYFYFTFYFLNSYPQVSKWRILTYITLPPLLLYIPLHVISDGTELSLPSSMFHFIGILTGFFAYKTQKFYQRALYQVLLFSLCLLMYIKGYDSWLNKLNYGTFTGQVSMQAPRFEFVDENGNRVSNEGFKNKIVVLDFWTTSCGVCFEKFPKVEALYKKMKNRSDIVIYSVNNPLKGDTKNNSINMIRERGYSFNILFADKNTANEQLNFNGYPTVFIIVNGREIIYKGNIENAESILGI